MSILFVQKLASPVIASGSPLQSGALASNPTLGNTLMCIVSTVDTTSGNVPTVSDTAGNSWTAPDVTFERSSSASDFERVSLYTVPVTVTGASFKVTVTTAGTSDTFFNVIEWSGLGVVDVSTTGGVGNVHTSLAVGPTSALSAVGELIIAGLGCEGSLTNAGLSDPCSITGPTLSTAATSLGVSQDGSTFNGAQWTYGIASSTSAPTATWTFTSDSASWNQYVGLVAAYKAAAGVPMGPRIMIVNP